MCPARHPCKYRAKLVIPFLLKALLSLRRLRGSFGVKKSDSFSRHAPAIRSEFSGYLVKSLFFSKDWLVFVGVSFSDKEAALCIPASEPPLPRLIRLATQAYFSSGYAPHRYSIGLIRL